MNTPSENVHLVFTTLGLHGVYRTKKGAEEVRDIVARKWGLDSWLEKWEVTQHD